MKIGIPAESRAGETRVAATPETVKKLVAAKHHVMVQAGAGILSSIPDAGLTEGLVGQVAGTFAVALAAVNVFGMSGMAIAAITTIALIIKLKTQAGGTGLGFGLVLVGLLAGGSIGAFLAKRVEMTKMPELVAAMHSLIGLAAVCIAVAAVSEPWAFGIAAHGDALSAGNRIELFIGTFVGAITFSGSVIAFGKLSGKYKFRLFQGAPVSFRGQHFLNLLLAVAIGDAKKVIEDMVKAID